MSPDADYAQMLQRLYRSRRSGVRLGLGPVTEVLSRLGKPHRRYPHVQIGGTNGKGSSVAFAEAIFARLGYRTATFTSPHLLELTERVRIAGQSVTRAELVAANEAVEAVGGETLTFFERMTCMALWIFEQRAVDMAILEVGLGGRLDATTATLPCVTAVTGIDLDHEGYLGHTLEEIAGEKAGIFRRNTAAVVGNSGHSEGRQLLIERARCVGTDPLVVVGTDHNRLVPQSRALAGAYQRDNAALAVALSQTAGQVLGFAVPEEDLQLALAQATWPGRFEWIDAALVVDGAHNPAAAIALSQQLPEGFVLLFACASDKNRRAMLEPLLARASSVVAVPVVGERFVMPELICEDVRALSDVPVVACASVANGLDRARELAGDRLVVATGSLFLVAEVRRQVLGLEADPIVVQDPVAVGSAL